MQLQLQLPLHYTTLHYTALHCTTLHYTTLHYTTLHILHYTYYTRLHYNTRTTLHYTTTTTTLITLHYITLHYTTTTTTHYIQQLWARRPQQPLQPFQKTQLQPSFGPSVDALCHPCFTTTNLSYRLPISETSATALCGTTGIYMCLFIYIYIYISIFSLRFSCLGPERRASTHALCWSSGRNLSTAFLSKSEGIMVVRQS